MPMVLENSNMHTAILTVTACRACSVVGEVQPIQKRSCHLTGRAALQALDILGYSCMYLAYQNLFLQHELCRNTT